MVRKIYLFYSVIMFSGKCTSSNNFILSYSQNERGFHGVIFGKKIKVCKGWENANLMLYRNICNVWCKNVIQISYKIQKFSVCFLLATGQIQVIYNYTITSLTFKFSQCCGYSKTYRYILFQYIPSTNYSMLLCIKI